jgi:hypothetical protein
VVLRKYALDYSVIREILINVKKMFNAVSLYMPSYVERT